MSIFNCIFALVVTFILPVAAGFWFASRSKKGLKPLILGTMTFLVFQVFTRLPLIQQFLPRFTWYQNMMSIRPVAVLFFAGTAALFEELGRYIMMKLFMKNQLSTMDGFIFGIGHGGIESVLFVGFTSIAVLFLGQSGIYGGAGMLISAFERVFAMSAQIGFSVMVAKSIREKKPIWLVFALLGHTVIDIIAGCVTIYGLNIWVAEGAIALFAILMWVYIIWEFKKGEMRI